MKSARLSFALGSAKLPFDTGTFSLPAGWRCPGARECLAKVKREGGVGSLVRGKHTRFTCYAASMEARNPSVRDARWRNDALLQGLKEEPRAMADLILASVPVGAKRVRIHVSGDFYSGWYFRAWCLVAEARPDLIFYAYTKSLAIWVNNLEFVPSNLKLIASKGGVWDSLIGQYGLRYAEVVFSPEQAQGLGLEIDHDDSLAWGSERNFALLLHGTQAAGTESAKALSLLKARGFKGYSAKKEAA